MQIHQYADAEIRTALQSGEPVAVRVQTRYPAGGEVRVEVMESPARPWTLSLRVPGWASAGSSITVDGEQRAVSAGYATVRREFQAGDVVRLSLPLAPRWTRPHPRIDAVRGTVAVERGPLVLALESVDLGASVNDVRVDMSVPPRERDGVTYVNAGTADISEAKWPYGGEDVAAADTSELGEVPLVPYHEWANRGPSTMRVWLPVAPT